MIYGTQTSLNPGLSPSSSSLFHLLELLKAAVPLPTFSRQRSKTCYTLSAMDARTNWLTVSLSLSLQVSPVRRLEGCLRVDGWVTVRKFVLALLGAGPRHRFQPTHIEGIVRLRVRPQLRQQRRALSECKADRPELVDISSASEVPWASGTSSAA